MKKVVSVEITIEGEELKNILQSYLSAQNEELAGMKILSLNIPECGPISITFIKES